MGRQDVLAHRAALERARHHMDEGAALLTRADAQWWRLIRNRRLFRDALAAFTRSRAAVAEAHAAWDAMSPSERAAENTQALRGAAVRRVTR